MIDSFAEEYEARLDSILNDTTRSCADRLRTYFDTGFDEMTLGEYTQGCLIGNLGQELAGQNEAFRDRVDRVFASWEKRFEHCLQDAQRAGDISADIDPADAASFLLSGWEGAILRSKVLKSTEPMDRFVRVFFGKCLNVS